MIALTTTYTARDIREHAALHVGCVQKRIHIQQESITATL